MCTGCWCSVASPPRTHPDFGVKRYRKSCAKTADSAANPIIHPLSPQCGGCKFACCSFCPGATSVSYFLPTRNKEASRPRRTRSCFEICLRSFVSPRESRSPFFRGGAEKLWVTGASCSPRTSVLLWYVILREGFMLNS